MDQEKISNKRVEVYDIETIVNFYSFYSMDIDTNEEFCFIIHKSKNQLLEFIEHLKNVKGQIGFNNIAFDAQVVQYIINTHHEWLDLNGEEVANLIYRYSQYVIEKSNNKEWSDYPEWKLNISQCDLYKIWHFDNKAKQTSLKWVQYMIDYHNIEEMPILHTTTVTEDMIPSIISYNRNDVLSTYEFYKITRGDTEHPLYKSINKIQLRKDINKEFNIQCRNYNDVKIGDEINKVSYISSLGIKKYDIAKSNKNIKLGKFKDYFPDYIQFKTSEFNNFINSIKEIELLDKKQEFKFSFNNTTYTIAKGGIHSEDKPRLIIPKEGEILIDGDIGSQYPNGIRKRRLYPKHLGPTWLKVYTEIIQKRLEAKKKYKETKDGKYQAIQEAYKLSLNGGGYGKLGEEYNWQYDLHSMYAVTIGNQMEILMLIEALELKGIHIVSANTDGITCLFNRDKLDLYYNICKEWEEVVGNNDLGQLEYVEYKLLAQTSVNDYIAFKIDSDIPKTKGDFVSEFELHKNKSARIVPLALQEYFKNGTNPEEFIKNGTNIFDFCLGIKSKQGAKFVSYNQKTGEEIKLQKVNRYFISTNGTNLLKRLKPLEGKRGTKQIDIFGIINDGTRQSEVEAGWLSTIYNKHTPLNKIKDYNIDYSFYIEKVNKIINSIIKN